MYKFNQTQNNYDRLSRWYDLLEGWGEKPICDEAIKLINFQSGEKILEIGSGTGTNLKQISRTVKNCEIMGFDLSNKMCKKAKRKAMRRKDFIIGLVNGNAIHLSFPKDYFDVVYLLFTLEIIPDEFIPLVLSECRRVLKPNGRICISAMSAEKMETLMMRLYLWSVHHFPEIVDCRPIDLNSRMEKEGFTPLVNRLMNLWGLPVRILLAK
jgi:ubiquinone/menaquinone biosynthesis C-methylase UbiE